MIGQCRSCRAPVIWARTEAGKRMPLDPEPTADGNVRPDIPNRYDGEGNVLVAVLGPLEREAHDGPLHVPHFATCPDADRWRRR